jgi:hypothetical protein
MDFIGGSAIALPLTQTYLVGVDTLVSLPYSTTKTPASCESTPHASYSLSVSPAFVTATITFANPPTGLDVNDFV